MPAVPDSAIVAVAEAAADHQGPTEDHPEHRGGFVPLVGHGVVATPFLCVLKNCIIAAKLGSTTLV